LSTSENYFIYHFIVITFVSYTGSVKIVKLALFKYQEYKQEKMTKSEIKKTILHEDLGKPLHTTSHVNTIQQCTDFVQT